MFHVIPTRIRDPNTGRASPARPSRERNVDRARVIHLDSVIRLDGVIHGIELLLMPRSTERLRGMLTVLPPNDEAMAKLTTDQLYDTLRLPNKDLEALGAARGGEARDDADLAEGAHGPDGDDRRGYLLHDQT
ncbi:hypothetical protein FH972_006604 [Carpinus fangiana]|uniref:FAS1 domain-containing protein n=1 Tax=Carpinus fangiana TaxID=176857 RepID=A0A5N6QT28_9ROSI|nr:hypothetical protein FH972_006604 [Carpinus fangiana]